MYVTGEVNNPGVYWVDEGSRIIDAIEAAGGTTDKANLTKINLVYVIEDGTKINIPSIKYSVIWAIFLIIIKKISESTKNKYFSKIPFVSDVEVLPS